MALFFLGIWLFNVYNTSGVFAEKKVTAIELYSVEMVKKTESGIEWILNADKLVKDDSYNKHYFTNVDFKTDPSSDSVQLIRSDEAMHDGNLKLVSFSGNVHARSIYPDTSENIVGPPLPSDVGVSNLSLETVPVTFFERGRPKKYCEDNFYSDALEYYYEHKILLSRMPVKFVKPKMEITGNSLEHKTKEKRGKIVGNVKIKIYED